MRTVSAILVSMRPPQWVKNSFVLAAPIFALRIFEPPGLLQSLSAAAIFCLLSGSVYIWNDLVDRERDQSHPEKKDRPIASGLLDVRSAAIAAVLLTSVGLFAGFRFQTDFGWICLAYIGNNLVYSHLLKRLVILDVMSLATGFVLRAMAGAEALQVEISNWLILCTFLLALFLGFSKRRHEIFLLEANAGEHRKTLEEYSPKFLDMMIGIVTASTVLSYALYTVSDDTIEKFHTKNLIFTTLFVVYGIFRYLYLVYCRTEGGNPTRVLFRDLPLKLAILCWLIVSSWIIYN